MQTLSKYDSYRRQLQSKNRQKMKKILILICALATLPISLSAQEISLKGKELFGNMNARHIGPALMSGRINDIEMHPTDARTLYAGTAGGGVWKSSDGGATFSPIFDEYAQSIGAVAVDPNDPDKTIWVGTGETWTRNSVSIGDGLFRTTDGGRNWKEIPGFENSERIASVEINPSNSNEVYVGVLGALWSDSEDRGVYKIIFSSPEDKTVYLKVSIRSEGGGNYEVDLDTAFHKSAEIEVKDDKYIGPIDIKAEIEGEIIVHLKDKENYVLGVKPYEYK